MAARFLKVSYEQFKADAKPLCSGSTALTLCFDRYNNPRSALAAAFEALPLPKRGTSGSAAYDFYSPFAFDLTPGHTITIPTGIRANMSSDTVLMLFPRSSMGVRYRIQLMNTVGIVDSDYFGAENEGHIILSLKNTFKRSIFPWVNRWHTWHVKPGDRICQGVFFKYEVVADDNATGKRVGGYGSTGR